MALKPVRAQQVRRPEWKQNWTVPHSGSVLPILAVLQLESRHRRSKLPKHHPLIILNIFIHFLAISFNSILNFFWLKRPNTSARTVVPLTTPLVISLRQVIGGQMLTCCLLSYYCGSCEVCVVQCVGQSFLLLHHICQQAGCGLRQGPDAIECCAVQLQRCSDWTAASWRWQALILFRCTGRTVVWCC